jgi:serine/threonine protein kinase
LLRSKSPQFPKLFYSDYFTENPITDDSLDENLYVSIEEFVESTPLSSKLGCYVGNPAEVFRIARSIAHGLKPLWEHPRKFVHRDVKPDNLLLKPDGEIVIIDFGIVRETGTIGITQEGVFQAPASFGYAAPEHLANDKDLVSFKTDVFSMGVVMYELISGSHPFLTRSNMDHFEIARVTENTVPVTLFELGVANQLESDVVARMMQKKPYLRPRTINLLLNDLNLNGAS